MATYGAIVDIPQHTTRTSDRGRTWSCTCGAGGDLTPAQLDDDVDVWDVANLHEATAAEALFPVLAPSQIAEALRTGACGNSQLVAAVELLIAHGHWIGYGYLRRYMAGGWGASGRFQIRIMWGALRGPLDEAVIARRILDATGAPAELVSRVARFAEAVQLDPGTGLPVIMASSSELAMLRIAASVAGHGYVALGEVVGNLDTTNRGLVLTALSHMISHGGSLDVAPALRWPGGDRADEHAHTLGMSCPAGGCTWPAVYVPPPRPLGGITTN